MKKSKHNKEQFEMRTKISKQPLIRTTYDLPVNFQFKLRLIEDAQYVWYRISNEFHLSDQFIEDFNDKLDWFNLCDTQELSLNILDKFFTKILWYKVFILQDLPEEFILNHKKDWTESEWEYILTNQKLSIDTIKENLHRIPIRNWHTIFWNEQMDIDEMCASGLDLFVKLTQKEMGVWNKWHEIKKDR